MPYNRNIPQANDAPRNSQPQLLENFQEIQDGISRDHVPFGDPDSGKHNKVSMPERTSPPVGATNEMTMWSQEVSNRSEILIRRETEGVFTPMTDGRNQVGGADIGYSYLPSGMLMKWGQAQTTGVGNGEVNVDITAGGTVPPFTSADFYVQLTAFEPDTRYSMRITSRITGPQGFTARAQDLDTIDGTVLNAPFHWFAVGQGV